MKNKSIIHTLLIAFIAISGILVSCEKKSDTNILPTEQDDLATASKMDLAIGNMFSYHDSCQTAKLHSSTKLHHYDSIYHHHDSLYKHHHIKYHHGDTAHHHTAYHHTPVHHHKHDSINHLHHSKIH